MAFTDEQNEQIRNDLIREARRCGITIGMRKTSVEQLTEAVGISKGSFYKFFDSKELLFFAVLEDIHTECFAAAQKSLQENTPLLPAERAAAAILAACRWLSKTKAFVFIENDADFLLHRLPEEVNPADTPKMPICHSSRQVVPSQPEPKRMPNARLNTPILINRVKKPSI